MARGSDREIVPHGRLAITANQRSAEYRYTRRLVRRDKLYRLVLELGPGLSSRTIAESYPKVRIVITKIDICILTAVAISFGLGVYLFFTGDREQGQFAASWVPAVLCFGIYFKMLVGGKKRDE
jgi:hypothetical protein